MADSTTGSIDPATAVRQYVDAFNRYDEDGMAACFAVPGHILDGMVPHVWSGPDAPRAWWRDALAEAGHLGVTDFFITLGAPLHNVVTGDAAYVVVPATMAFKVRGQQVTQSGALFTAALRRQEGRWLIASWAWTKGTGGGTGDVPRPAG